MKKIQLLLIALVLTVTVNAQMQSVRYDTIIVNKNLKYVFQLKGISISQESEVSYDTTIIKSGEIANYATIYIFSTIDSSLIKVVTKPIQLTKDNERLRYWNDSPLGQGMIDAILRDYRIYNGL